MKKKDGFYRKDLKEVFGLEENWITAIVSRTSVFKGVAESQGYATKYGYDQTFWILVGSALLALGMPIRYPNLVLIKLSSFKDLDFYNNIRKHKLVIVLTPTGRSIFGNPLLRGGGKIVVNEQNPNHVFGDMLFGNVMPKEGSTELANRKHLCFELGKDFAKKRISPLVMLLEENDCKAIYEEPYKSIVPSFVAIKLHLLLEKLDRAFG